MRKKARATNLMCQHLELPSLQNREKKVFIEATRPPIYLLATQTPYDIFSAGAEWDY